MSLVTKATAAANETCSKQTEQDEADTYTGGSVGRGQCHTHTQRTAILQLTCDMEIIRHANSNTCIEISAAAPPTPAPPTNCPPQLTCQYFSPHDQVVHQEDLLLELTGEGLCEASFLTSIEHGEHDLTHDLLHLAVGGGEGRGGEGGKGRGGKGRGGGGEGRGGRGRGREKEGREGEGRGGGGERREEEGRGVGRGREGEDGGGKGRGREGERRGEERERE